MSTVPNETMRKRQTHRSCPRRASVCPWKRNKQNEQREKIKQRQRRMREETKKCEKKNIV